MEKDVFWQLLEDKFLTYRDLKNISVIENREPMISLRSQGISYSVLDELIVPSNGDDIFLRAGVAEKLKRAQEILNSLMTGCILDVVYGYRSLQIQTDSYLNIRKNILSASPDMFSAVELNEAIHRFIAVPDVSGHPTGGAVDVRLLDKNGQEVDMGTRAHDFKKESYTFNPFVSKDVWLNRQKLRQVMLSVGFAPFDGEWWHFSYGDREWAAYYSRPNAIYEQLEFIG